MYKGTCINKKQLLLGYCKWSKLGWSDFEYIKKYQDLSTKYHVRGQSYKTFYTLGQIYKHTLMHVNNPMHQTFVCHNVRTLHPYIFIGFHFSFSLNQRFRHFFYTAMSCKKFYRIGSRCVKTTFEDMVFLFKRNSLFQTNF